MTNLLCKTKNQTGQTLPQIFATNSNILNEIFNSVSNHPVILYEILTTPDKNGAYLGDIVASGKNKDARKLLNEKLYYIAGLDRSISPKIATRALIANEYILDEANEALLKSF